MPNPPTVFLTTNEEKFEEIAALLEEEAGLDVERRTARLPFPPDNTDPAGVARFRSLKAYGVFRQPVFAEALAIELADGTLSGASYRQAFEEPGGSPWLKKHDGAPGLARIAVGYTADGLDAQHFETVIRGRVTATGRGEGNAPWESFWIPEGRTETLAELADDPIADELQNAPYIALARALRPPASDS